MENFGRCKACKKQILWVRMLSGTQMPCDPEILRFDPAGRFSEGKKDKFVTSQGDVRYGIVNPEGKEQGYISHFATCPAADSFRRPKDKKGE